MSSRVPLTIAELEHQLEDQLNLLKIDVDSYDRGAEIAAKNIAGKLRVLLHDTSKSHSLLGRLGKKDNTLFLDTSHAKPERTNPGAVFSYTGLTHFSLGNGGARYIPHLDGMSGTPTRLIPFDTWWNAIIVLDMEGASFSRRDLVLILANQDGGAHVDPNLDEKYYKLTRQNSLNWQTSSGEGGWKAVSNPHYSAIRQIAHEVLKSLIPLYTASSSRNAQAGLSDLKIAFTPADRTSQECLKQKVGRNDPCPCGSGKKFKRCHG